MASDTIYYHGGPAGLSGEILPPSVTGKPSCVDYGALRVARKDRVYITTDPIAARIFGAFGPHKGPSCVYVVEPIGDIEDDPDCDTPGLSYQCERAQIIRIHSVVSQSARHRLQTSLMAALRIGAATP